MKKKVVVVLCFMMAMMVLLAGCGSKPTTTNQTGNQTSALPAQTVTVAAAASLQDPLTEAIALYNKTQPNVKVDVNYGGSGALYEQIKNGAPVDIFISASKKYLDQAEDAKLVAANTRFNWLTNSLVVVTSSKSDKTLASLDDVAKLGKIAIGTPDSVPAGKYAQEALTKAGLWDKVKGKLVQGKDVKAVASYVASGSADAGFVYASDTYGRDDLKTQFTVDSALHSAILYPVAVINSTKVMEAATSFTDFLKTDEAKAIFTKYGFGAAK